MANQVVRALIVLGAIGMPMLASGQAGDDSGDEIQEQRAPEAGAELEFDYDGFRVRLPGVSKEDILATADTPLQELLSSGRLQPFDAHSRDDQGQTGDEDPPISLIDAFDGLFWGSGTNAYACQSYDSFKGFGWARFGTGPRPSSFPRGTMLSGRHDGFYWMGMTSSSTMIWPTDVIDGIPGAGTPIVSDEIVGYTLDAEAAFRESWSFYQMLAEAGKGLEPGDVVRNVLPRESGGCILDMQYQLGSGSSKWMRAFYSTDHPTGSAERFMVSSIDPRAGQTTILSVRLGSSKVRDRELPDRPDEIPAIYVDVQGMDSVTYWDFTSLGQWPEGGARFLEDWASSGREPELDLLSVVAVHGPASAAVCFRLKRVTQARSVHHSGQEVFLKRLHRSSSQDSFYSLSRLAACNAPRLHDRSYSAQCSE